MAGRSPQRTTESVSESGYRAYRLSSARPCELSQAGAKRGTTARAPPVNGIGVVSLSLLVPE